MGLMACFAAIPPAELARLRFDDVATLLFFHPETGAPAHQLDLGEYWHGLHYLLTGTADGGEAPLRDALLGGEEFGPRVGFGPARFLLPRRVARMAAALQALTPATLSMRFDPVDMAAKEIYPDDLWEREGAAALEQLLKRFAALQAFYRAAAERGDAVLLWLA